jgi:hypothetical protein
MDGKGHRFSLLLEGGGGEQSGEPAARGQMWAARLGG